MNTVKISIDCVKIKLIQNVTRDNVYAVHEGEIEHANKEAKSKERRK